MTYGIYLDSSRCGGCRACEVACMDQNDLEAEEQMAWCRVAGLEKGSYPDVSVTFNYLACRHCQDPPCIMACPTKAITKLDGAVLVKAELCSGCRSCSLACPFGVPSFSSDGKMKKCNLCIERVKQGLEPACVRACPTHALQFGLGNDWRGIKGFAN